MKQWSLPSVCFSHSYHSVAYATHHDLFINWIKKNFTKKIKVVDIGGGNARFFLGLKPYVDFYWNLDLNVENITIANKFFLEEKCLKSILFDGDFEEFSIDCDVVYIDSVLTMIEKPFDALLKFKNFCDYIFINRTSLDFTSSQKKNYKWAGMISESILWEFDKTTMLNFCENHNMELNILKNNSFVIKTNKTSDE